MSEREDVAVLRGMKVGESDLRLIGDDDLLNLVAQSNQRAFRVLVERHVDRGYAVALRILNNPSDAEDVVQDAFLQVWTKRDRWQCGRAKFSTWLFRVVTNRCIDLLRKPKIATMDTLPEIEDKAPDQMQVLAKQEAVDLLYAAMARLPDQQRVALILSYTESMSNAEIADIMETTLSAVESLLKRGRHKLRHILRNKSESISTLFTND
ncbi:RNA polymerase sigma factor [Roseibium aggregatum]|uniref:RNA polymerase sigma factor n=1 Tax=Roseibium aggregatum TaxID=187304 RepID=UPI003A96FCCD